MAHIVQCLNCMDVIESKTNHDFKECRCGQTFVDGGPDPKFGRVGYGVKGFKRVNKTQKGA